MSIFSKRLKEIRQLKTETQKEIARKIGISERQFSILESDKSVPTVETLIKLCEYFQVSADYLLGLSDIKERR